MINELRWKQRFQNFNNAYKTMCRTLDRLETGPDDEVVQMALVQTFEFTYELAWNTLKDYLEKEGYTEVTTPKVTIMKAIQAQLVSQEWISVIQKRNLASHTYNESILEETVHYIKEEFYPLVKNLHDKLMKEL